METLENAGDVGGRTKGSYMRQTHQNSRLYSALNMRLLFAILGLLLCLVASHADKPIVIKDSEAAHYVGKNVEVRGRVVSVTTSPLGTAFINFGGAYPNQTFAGFIAAGSKIATNQRIATLQGKIISITGTIELYRGKPEIKVLSMNQIKGAD
jgi:DNA/RNA endonuclease YhcR with UshA esterase domain